jgi:hypothetical protein
LGARGFDLLVRGPKPGFVLPILPASSESTSSLATRVGYLDQLSGSSRSLLDDIKGVMPLNHVLDILNLMTRLNDEPG